MQNVEEAAADAAAGEPEASGACSEVTESSETSTRVFWRKHSNFVCLTKRKSVLPHKVSTKLVRGQGT